MVDRSRDEGELGDDDGMGSAAVACVEEDDGGAGSGGGEAVRTSEREGAECNSWLEYNAFGGYHGGARAESVEGRSVGFHRGPSVGLY